MPTSVLSGSPVAEAQETDGGDGPALGELAMNPDNFANMTRMVALLPSVSVITPITMIGVGLFGNIIALGVYQCSCTSHRRIPFYGIFKGLLWTNVVGYLAAYPLIIAAYFNDLKWIGGSHTCNFQGMAILSFGMSTSLLVGCMGFERFLAICKPLLYAKRVERRKTPYLVFLVWVFAVFTAFMPIVGFGEMVQHYPGTWCFVNWRHKLTVGKLYTSILAAELSGVLMLVFSCLAITVIVTVVKAACLDAARRPRDGGVVGVTGSSIRRMSARLIRQSENGSPNASLWFTVHYVFLACTCLVCLIPIVIRIIKNVSGEPEDQFATFMAMGFAEIFPASIPWIYILFHRQMWRRLLPCCFPKALPVATNGAPGGHYYHFAEEATGGGGGAGSETPPAGVGGVDRADTDPQKGNNVSGMLPNNVDDGTCAMRSLHEVSAAADILTIRNVARKNQQPSKQFEKNRNNGHAHGYAGGQGGNMARVEYHALMRMMDEGSHGAGGGAIDDSSQLAKACQFGKESTI